MLELSQQLSLIDNRVYRLFVDDSNLGHFFHGIHGSELFALHLPNFAEATLASNVVKLEMSPIDACKIQL